MKKMFLTALFFIFFAMQTAYSQTRLVVLPFDNMDGKIEMNVWCYDLRDSLINALKKEDPESKYYNIVPSDEVEDAVAELNLDPSNPQYKTDIWKAIKKLNAKKVVMANFNLSGEYFLFNAYIYNPKMKLADPDYQAKDIFKKVENIYECVPEIVKAILPGLKQ